MTLATELAGTDVPVLVLEGGGIEFTRSLRDLPQVVRRHARDEQRLAGGRNVGLSYYPLRFTRARAVGGSSRAWAYHGLKAHPLDAVDLEEREPIRHSGWPIDMAELAPLYRRAQEVCNLGPFAYDADDWDHEIFGAPLPLDRNHIRTNVFQFGQHSAFDRFLPHVSAAANIDLMTSATVVHISADRSDRVTGVRCRTLSGNHFTVAADTVVLAAGAIETARLLLASNDVHRAGIGNDRDLVGRFFMEHPDLEVGFLLPDEDLDPSDMQLYQMQAVSDDLKIRGMLRCSENLLRSEGLLNSVIRLRPTYRTGMEPAVRSARRLRRSLHNGVPSRALVTDAMRLAAGVEAARAHRATERWGGPYDAFRLEMMTEQVPHPESRVTLGTRRDRLGVPRTMLDWRMQPTDWWSIRRTTELVLDHMADAGVGRVVPTVANEHDGERLAFGNWHHMGTTRMHEDPSEGVVNADGRVHGIENLYLSGASVFPTGGYANPTLTIVALALRLADHLEKLART